MKKSILLNYIDDVWNNKIFDKVEQYIDKEYTVYLDTDDPWEGKTISHQVFKARLRYSFDSFPDMHFEITSGIEDKNHVAVTWILTGKNTGLINGYQPTGKNIKTNGMTIYHFNNNLINGHTQVFDRVTVAKQLGFID